MADWTGNVYNTNGYISWDLSAPNVIGSARWVPPTQLAPPAALNANRTPSPQSPLTLQGPKETLDDVLYGQVIPMSGGRRLVRGRLIWWSAPRVISTAASASGTATVMDIAVSFGYPLTSSGKRGILKIKAGVTSASTVIYDMTVSPPVNAVGLDFKFYTGTEDQLPDPTIEASKGVGHTSAYRGQMYAVFKNFPIDLFIENGTPVAPLFSALIADDFVSTISTFNYTNTTGTSIGSNGAVDWDAGLIYQWTISGALRLVVYNIWSQDELYDLPIIPHTTAFTILQNQGAFIDGLDLLLFNADGGGSFHRLALVDPLSGAVVCEASTAFAVEPGTDQVNNQITWNVDRTAAPGSIYLFAGLSDTKGVLEVFVFDQLNNTITSLGATGLYLDGTAPAATSSVSSIVHGGNTASGNAIFYVGSTAHVHKIVVNIDGGLPYAETIFCNTAVNLLHFLPNENALVVFGPSGAAAKYRCSDGALLWSVTLPFTVSAPVGITEIVTTDTWRSTQAWFAWLQNGVGWYFVDLVDGTYTFQADAGSTAYRLIFDSETKSSIMSPRSGTPQMHQFTATSSGVYAFSDIVLQMAALAGYQDGQVTITGISDTFEGVILDQDTDFLGFLTSQADLLNYQVVEDQTIRVFRIPDSPTPDFAIDDTMCLDNGRDGPITVRDEQETSFASKLELQYRDPVTDYSYNSQLVQRPLIPVPTTASNRKDTIQSPLIMSADQAVTLVTPVIYRRAASSTKLTINGLPILCAAAPGDIITATQGPNTYTAKIKQNRLEGSLQNQITAEVILTQTTFSRIGSAGDAAVFSWSAGNPASRAILLDGPIINFRTDLAGLGLYYRWLVMSRGQSNWPGAQFYYSYDGVSFTAAAGTASTDQIIHVGSAIATLPDNPAPFLTDYTNTLKVAPVSGDFSTLASVTYAQMIAGQTLAYVGAPGRWEVIGFETFTNNGDGTYSFSGLARGLYGTEVFSGQHAPGDLFVFIGTADNGIHASSFAASALGDALSYKAVGFGQVAGAAVTNTATVSGNAEKPPAPVHLDAVISGSDIALSCARRSRFVQHILNWGLVDSETADGWEFDVMSGSTVLRTLASSTPAATYTAAQITADFGTIPASLKFRAYRIGHDHSLSVGRGFRAEATITL